MTKRYPSAIAIAALRGELAGTAPQDILLIPAGSFRARDGRPQDAPEWRLDADAAALVIAKAQTTPGDFVIDYEHQTLHSDANGQPAPAAAWFKTLEWRPDGLHAVDVRWTAKAKGMIEAGEYRYLSPVFEYSKKTGVVLAVLMAAITNYPAIEGHSELVAMAAAKFQPHEETPMDREKMIALLGLAADASDAQIEQAVAALKATAATVQDKDHEIAALKANPGQPDPARFVPLAHFEALKGEVVALKSSQQASTVATLVTQAIADGKLLPVQEQWATELGQSNLAALTGYLTKTPAIAALSTLQTGNKKPLAQGGDELNETEVAVCRNMGIDPADYKKANTAA
jgi:phage I-like protein